MNKFKQLRKAKGYTQKEIGPLLGLSPRTIEGYEQGRRKPPQTVFILLDTILKKKGN